MKMSSRLSCTDRPGLALKLKKARCLLAGRRKEDDRGYTGSTAGEEVGVHGKIPSPRNQSYYILFNRTLCAKLEEPTNLENRAECSKGHLINGAYHRKMFNGGFWSAPSLVWGRNLSSHVGSTSSDKEGDLEDGFSDLEVPPETDQIEKLEANVDDELIYEGNTSGEDADETGEDILGFPGRERIKENILAKESHNSQFLKTIMHTPRYSLGDFLNQWVEGGNPLGRAEVSWVVLNLRKRRWFGKALQFVEWVEANKGIEFKEQDYASCLDLVAKVWGLPKAEQYIEKIPKSFRGEVVYRTLLANCVAAVNVMKSEEVFNKIRDLGFPISTFSCNQLILLYSRVDRKKIGDVLKLMEKEDVKPSLFTYKLLIDAKGRIPDISGMEEVITTMTAEGIEPDFSTLGTIAKHYIFACKNEKAEKILRDIEGGDITKNRAACIHLLPHYASLRKIDDVARIWKVCETKPYLEECRLAIEAWGKLGKIDEAEEVFEKMIKSWKRLSPKFYNGLLMIYANHKLLSKGKELAKRMSDDGCKIGPLTWDALVKLHVNCGQVEKADSILQKASEQSPLKPLYSSYIYVLEKYADRGDIHNAEKLFHRLRLMGYVGRMRQYQLLLRAYVNAKTPAYGFRERMKADNIFPNRAALSLLQAADAFKKTQISELLD